MEVILLKDLDKVGAKHEIVTVRNGYGRNYLIPQGLAIVANDSNRGKLNQLIRKEAAVESKAIDENEALAARLSGKVLRIGAKAGTSGKIFGSVTNIQLAQALKEQLDIDIERNKIEIEEEVKVLGNYTAKVNLHSKVKTTLNFEVVED